MVSGGYNAPSIPSSIKEWESDFLVGSCNHDISSPRRLCWKFDLVVGASVRTRVALYMRFIIGSDCRAVGVRCLWRSSVSPYKTRLRYWAGRWNHQARGTASVSWPFCNSISLRVPFPFRVYHKHSDHLKMPFRLLSQMEVTFDHFISSPFTKIIGRPR